MSDAMATYDVIVREPITGQTAVKWIRVSQTTSENLRGIIAASFHQRSKSGDLLSEATEYRPAGGDTWLSV